MFCIGFSLFWSRCRTWGTCDHSSSLYFLLLFLLYYEDIFNHGGMFSKKSMSQLMITGRNGKRRREESWGSTRYTCIYVMMTRKEYFPLKGNEDFWSKLSINNKSRSTVKDFWRKFSNFWSRIEVWPRKERRRRYRLSNYDLILQYKSK